MSLTDRLWASVEPKVFVTKEQYLANLEGWELEPVIIGDELAYLTMTKGPAFHVHSFGTSHCLPLRRLATFVQAIIDQHGYATTRTPHDDLRQHRFNQRFGFVAVGEDFYDVQYRIEKVRLGCRS